MLTTYDADLDILRAVKAGAKGYLLKDARREELLDCIRKVNSGETRIPQALMQKLVTGISSEPMTDREADKRSGGIAIASGYDNFTILNTV